MQNGESSGVRITSMPVDCSAGFLGILVFVNPKPEPRVVPFSNILRLPLDIQYQYNMQNGDSSGVPITSMPEVCSAGS